MANELHATGCLYYRDANGVENALPIIDDIISVTTKKTTRVQQTIGTSEEAIEIGEVSMTGAILMVVNRDATNFVEVKVGTGGTVIGRLTPQRRFLILPVGSGITAPFAVADTAPCIIDIFAIAL